MGCCLVIAIMYPTNGKAGSVRGTFSLTKIVIAGTRNLIPSSTLRNFRGVAGPCVYFIQFPGRKSVNLAGGKSTPHYLKHSLSKLPERAGR
jgi:hypothetical protein